MKNIVWSTLFIALFSSNVMAEECSSQDRVDYYSNVQKKYQQNPTKYSRFISSNEYVIWDVSVHISHLIGLANSAKGYVKNDDPFNEFIMNPNLFMRAISDHSEYFASYRDGKILVNRKLVTTKDSDKAKLISFKIAPLGLCVENPLTTLGTK